jgi:hypothetical protein
MATYGIVALSQSSWQRARWWSSEVAAGEGARIRARARPISMSEMVDEVSCKWFTSPAAFYGSANSSETGDARSVSVDLAKPHIGVAN